MRCSLLLQLQHNGTSSCDLFSLPHDSSPEFKSNWGGYHPPCCSIWTSEHHIPSATLMGDGKSSRLTSSIPFFPFKFSFCCYCHWLMEDWVVYCSMMWLCCTTGRWWEGMCYSWGLWAHGGDRTTSLPASTSYVCRLQPEPHTRNGLVL